MVINTNIPMVEQVYLEQCAEGPGAGLRAFVEEQKQKHLTSWGWVNALFAPFQPRFNPVSTPFSTPFQPRFNPVSTPFQRRFKAILRLF
jgi:hypothetical protein